MYSPSHNWEFQYNLNKHSKEHSRKEGRKEGRRKEASTGHRQTKKQEELKNEPKKTKSNIIINKE